MNSSITPLMKGTLVNGDVLVIDGALRREIREAIISAFGSLAEFRVVVSEALNQKLAGVIAAREPADAKTTNLGVAAFHVILWCVENHKLRELVSAAARYKPDSARLGALARRLDTTRTGKPEEVVLESVPFQAGEEWEVKNRRVRRTVCRIEPQQDHKGGYGTGFLVGPSIVMTNFHVVKKFPKTAKRGREKIVFRFDHEFRLGQPSVPDGRMCELADDWLLFHSVETKLDFAVIRLADRPGDDRVEGGQRRFLQPVDYTFTANETLFIFQHPDGGRSFTPQDRSSNRMRATGSPTMSTRKGDRPALHVPRSICACWLFITGVPEILIDVFASDRYSII